jgi:hypothetical protein
LLGSEQQVHRSSSLGEGKIAARSTVLVKGFAVKLMSREDMPACSS